MGWLLVLGPALAISLGAATARAAEAPACVQGRNVSVWTSPARPVVGQPVRVMVVGDTAAALDGELRARGEADRGRALTTVGRGGPPWSLAGEWTPKAAGRYEVRLERKGSSVTCTSIDVVPRGSHAASPAGSGAAWATTRAWNRATENLYSAWIEALFDAPVGESLSFPSLAPVLRDPKRNFLHEHLALGEDTGKTALPAEPDCADLPYYLRAYFAWKLGLPFGMRDCDRGSSTAAPRCGTTLLTNEGALPPTGKTTTALGAFRQFLRKLANTVHSGSGRTALEDEATDHYPVKLTREALRPGTIYADPYGHVLMLAKWVPQTESSGGLLFAVDGQPDNSVSRKRFWEGTFLYAQGLPSAGPGWKAFRPLVRETEGGPLVPLGNGALETHADFAPHSRELESMSPEAFYARMGKLINPRGLEPQAAYEETLAALHEQLQARVGSVDNGEAYLQKAPLTVIPMPDGPKIFETVGAWEDYATPSRDMRLIIAMNVLTSLPDRVLRHPDLFVLGGRKPAEVKAELLALHEKLTREKAFTYKRSDGSEQRLTVADALLRKDRFEMAYNPNDCVETRWGARQGSPEHATCTRRAPPDQVERMELYRAWFREAKRPPR